MHFRPPLECRKDFISNSGFTSEFDAVSIPLGLSVMLSKDELKPGIGRRIDFLHLEQLHGLQSCSPSPEDF